MLLHSTESAASSRRWPWRPEAWGRFLPAAAVLAVSGVLVAFAAWPMLHLLRPVRVVEVAPALPPLRASGATAGAPSPAASTPGPDRRTVQAAGWLEPSPYPAVVGSLTDGVIATMGVLEGESVSKGQVLATLVSADAELALRHATAGVAAARAGLAGAEAGRVAARVRWEEAVEVTRAVAVAEAERAMAESDVAAHPALVREAEANRARWEEELVQRRSAGERGAASPREVSIAREAFAAREAEVEALEARRPGVAARRDRAAAVLAAARTERELRVADRLALDSAEAAVAAARATVQLAETTEAEARLRLERTVLRSPIDGNVLRRVKSPGEKVRLGTDAPHSAHVFHLYDPASLQVRVDVPLGDAAEVSLGQACEVVVDVLPDTPFRGEVLRITHEADVQKNTLEVQVRVLDPSPLLKPEMLARVRFRGRPDGTGPDPKRTERADGSGGEARVRVLRACLDDGRVWAVRGRGSDRGVAVAVPVVVLEDGGELASVRGDLRVGDLLIVLPEGQAADWAAGEPVRFHVARSPSPVDPPEEGAA